MTVKPTDFSKDALRMTIMDQPQDLKAPSIDKERLRQKYLEERDKRLRADGNDQYLQVTGHLARYLDDPYTPVDGARAEDRPRHLRLHRRRLCRARHRGAAVGSRDQGRPHHREGRRFRRHLVLEPVSRRAMRYGVADLHADARRNRAHAVGEIRACAGNPRALPAHRQTIRPLRQRAVSHHRRKPRMGRGEIALEHPHQPRR